MQGIKGRKKKERETMSLFPIEVPKLKVITQLLGSGEDFNWI